MVQTVMRGLAAQALRESQVGTVAVPVSRATRCNISLRVMFFMLIGIPSFFALSSADFRL